MNTAIVVLVFCCGVVPVSATQSAIARGGATAEWHSFVETSSGDRTRAFVPPESERLRVAVRDVMTVLVIGFLGFLFLILGAYYFYAPRETRPRRWTRHESKAHKPQHSSSDSEPKPNPDDFDFEYFYSQIDDDESPRS